MAPYARSRATKRFVAALVVSVLAHLFLSSAFTGGSVRGAISRVPGEPEAQQLIARLRLPEVDFTGAASAPHPEPLRSAGAKVQQESVARRAVPPRESKPKAASPAPVDPTYYGARDLDVYPALIGALDLSDATVSDSKGHVLLLVLLDATGAVNEVSVVEADPPGLHDESALRAFRSARFSPAVRDGRAVRSRLMIDVGYGDDDRATR